MEYFEFDCGCKFKVLDNKVNKDGLPSLEYDFYNLRNCNRVWDLFETGNTKGVFQLESQLGQTWCEKFKPKSIDEIAILTSILRPGSLEAKFEDKTVSQHFVDRKHGLEPCTPMHPALGDILKETYNLGCFQEQSIQIVKDVAGFTEGESEVLRKSIGKKDVKKMAELKPKFIQGCINNGLTEKDGEDIFGIIETSERYGFNRCLTADTTVQTKRGKKKLYDVEVGDWIEAPMKYVEVTAFHENGEKPIVKFTLECGRVMKSTLEHKFLCGNGEILTLYHIISNNNPIVVKDGGSRGSKIVRMEWVGQQKTYDITVDSLDHIYYANEVATSNSHATIYSYLTYATAYLKVHFPNLFFTAWLHDAKEKIDPIEERKELIADAKRFGMTVCSPTLKYLGEDLGEEFFNIKNKIYFGLVDIKGIGYAEIGKLKKQIVDGEKLLDKDIKKWTWLEFLSVVAPNIKKTIVNSLILVGAVPGIESRKRMLLEYKVFSKLNDKEIAWVTSSYTKYNLLSDCLKDYLDIDKKDGGPYNSASVKKINNLIDVIEKVPYNTSDDIAWITANEINLMGVSLSAHILDDYDICGDTTCKEIYNGKDKGAICVQITSVRDTVTKNGKNPGQEMCFVKLEDQTDSIDGVCFPNVYSKYKDIIYVGSVVLASVARSAQGKGVIVNSISKVS